MTNIVFKTALENVACEAESIKFVQNSRRNSPTGADFAIDHEQKNLPNLF